MREQSVAWTSKRVGEAAAGGVTSLMPIIREPLGRRTKGSSCRRLWLGMPRFARNALAFRINSPLCSSVMTTVTEFVKAA
jgi:hypothetical protein